MSFAESIEHVLANEGGYVNNPNDPGGETAYGIAKRYNPEVDIKALTREGAIAIYREKWWDRYHLGAITNPVIATKVLDLLVNPGPGGGARIIQDALNAVGVPTNADGVFGLQTLANCNKAHPAKLLAELRMQTALYYFHRILERPTSTGFIKGWLRRAVIP